jgi:hypothetical protein
VDIDTLRTISISRNTRDALKRMNNKRQTYDEIISDLIRYRVRITNRNLLHRGLHRLQSSDSSSVEIGEMYDEQRF